MVYTLKSRNSFGSKQQDTITYGIMLSQTNINQAEKYFKKQLNWFIYGYGLAVAKLNLVSYDTPKKTREQRLIERS
jgi:hypothetical protein